MSWFEEASKRRKWLVGVSGGADSVALLHLLLQHGFRNLVVCHLDHRLRGRASTGDAKFVERLAGKLGLPFEGGRVDVTRLAAERRESVETAARGARHEFFRNCARLHRCHRVVLAHHADDQAETVLWNLLRGSYGLKGMRQIQDMEGLELHRPLLSFRRMELREWLLSERFKWRDDATNTEPLAIRNRLRNEAIPLLAAISGRDPAAALARLATDWNEQSSILDYALEKADIIDPQGRLHLQALRVLPPSLQRAGVTRYLMGEGVQMDRESLNRVMQTVDSIGPPAVHLPGGRRFRRRAGRAFIE